MKKVPLRQCVACREMKPKAELIRIAKSPFGEISVDNTYKKPGRGAYLCKNEKCYTRAIKVKSLSRALKSPMPEEVLLCLEMRVAGS